LTGSSEGDEVHWITWFVSLKGNDYICEVEEEYIQDDFNLTGLSSMVPFYDYALDMMLDVEIPTERFTDDQLEMVETATEVLYGLIHARYILTTRGMQRMKEKFAAVDFGRCPRVNCQGQPVLPVGLSDMPRNYCVNLYCPCCRDIFYPKSARQATLDGAYFGATFAHMFLLCNPDILPARPNQTYIPRVFGFRIHKDSTYWQHSAALPNTSQAQRGAAGGATSTATSTGTGNGSNVPSTIFNMPFPAGGGSPART